MRWQFDVRICVTAQHRDMLDQVLQVFEVEPHYDLNAMRSGQTLTSATSLILSALEPVLQSDRPDLVLVQGDTATTLCGALAAFYCRNSRGTRRGRSTDRGSEPAVPGGNESRGGGPASALHFAATPWAAANLRAEGVDDCRITVTGNTGIDAVLYMRDRLERNEIRGAPGRNWIPAAS